MSGIGDFRITFSILEAAEPSFLLVAAMASMATRITSARSSGLRYFRKNCRKNDRRVCSGMARAPGPPTSRQGRDSLRPASGLCPAGTSVRRHDAEDDAKGVCFYSELGAQCGGRLEVFRRWVGLERVTDGPHQPCLVPGFVAWGRGGPPTGHPLPLSSGNRSRCGVASGTRGQSGALAAGRQPGRPHAWGPQRRAGGVSAEGTGCAEAWGRRGPGWLGVLPGSPGPGAQTLGQTLDEAGRLRELNPRAT